VETWSILSARPIWVTAATLSPPPTIEVPALSARRAAMASVPCANGSISKTPMGPFQSTSFARRLSA
jgi:hypothetical protein